MSLTQIEIAAMKADMEAGTPGPWFVSGVRAKIAGQPFHAVVRYDAATKQDEHICAVWYDPKTNAGWADARRIARVPAMEATIIEQAERIAALEKALDDLRHNAHEATDPDFLYGAMDNVNDMDVSLEIFADAASRAARAALGDAP